MSASAAAAKWGKSVSKPEGNELQCWRNALVGCMAGAFVGGTYGLVNGAMSLTKRKPRLTGAVFLREWAKLGISTGAACAGYFTAYHSILCSMRYFGLNKQQDKINVGVAAVVPAIPLVYAARRHVFVCGMLVLLDNVSSKQLVGMMTGQSTDDDEYEYEDDDDSEY